MTCPLCHEPHTLSQCPRWLVPASAPPADAPEEQEEPEPLDAGTTALQAA